MHASIATRRGTDRGGRQDGRQVGRGRWHDGHMTDMAAAVLTTGSLAAACVPVPAPCLVLLLVLLQSSTTRGTRCRTGPSVGRSVGQSLPCLPSPCMHACTMQAP